MTEQHIPKGYKLTEVGVIPEDWEVKSISEITDCTAGGTPNTRISKYWGGDHRWMNSGELHIREIFDVAGRITDEGLFNSSTKYIPKNSILIGLAGQGKTRGTVAINRVKLCTNQSIAAIFPSKQYIVEYLFYNLDNRYEELRAASTGDGGRGGLNLTIIKKLKIAFPLLEEQTAIANALSDTDALINQLKKLITKKQAIKTATMQQLLTGKARLPEFAYRADVSLKGTKISELGEIPEDWDIYNFGSLINYIKGYPFKASQYISDGVSIIRVSDTTYDTIKSNTPVFIDEKEAQNYKRWQLKEGDLIFSTVGSKPPMYDSLVGKVVLVVSKHAGSLLNQNAVLIRPKSKVLNFNYLLLNHFRTTRYIDFIETIYRGNANQASITLESLFQYKIQLPTDIKEQTVIANILSEMDQEITLLETRLAKTEQIKQGMMQQLLTGKIRLL